MLAYPPSAAHTFLGLCEQGLVGAVGSSSLCSAVDFVASAYAALARLFFCLLLAFGLYSRTRAKASPGTAVQPQVARGCAGSVAQGPSENSRAGNCQH